MTNRFNLGACAPSGFYFALVEFSLSGDTLAIDLKGLSYPAALEKVTRKILEVEAWASSHGYNFSKKEVDLWLEAATFNDKGFKEKI